MEDTNTGRSLILYGNTYENTDLYYATGFLTSEEVLYVETGNRKTLLTSRMDKERAMEESSVDEVLTLKELLGKTKASNRKAEAVKNLLKRHGSDKVYVPDTFPVGIYSKLDGIIDVKMCESPYGDRRSVKAREEIKKIKGSQRSARIAVEKTRKVLERSEVKKDELFYKDRPLTQGRVKRIILHELIDMDCDCRGLIVSSGKESSFPHKTGKGERTIRPDTPVIVDVFPVDRETRYCGDMTRTFVKGKASEKMMNMYNAVVEAQRKALDSLEPGLKTGELDKSIRSFLDKEIQGTIGDRRIEFKHSTGHGIGLDVHEKPHIGKDSNYRLKPGNVVAIEPGLYGPEGGVRIEDIAVVTEEGSRILEETDRSIMV